MTRFGDTYGKNISSSVTVLKDSQNTHPDTVLLRAGSSLSIGTSFLETLHSLVPVGGTNVETAARPGGNRPGWYANPLAIPDYCPDCPGGFRIHAQNEGT